VAMIGVCMGGAGGGVCGCVCVCERGARSKDLEIDQRANKKRNGAKAPSATNLPTLLME